METNLAVSAATLLGKKLTQHENHKFYLEIREMSARFSRTTKFLLLNSAYKLFCSKQIHPQKYGIASTA